MLLFFGHDACRVLRVFWESLWKKVGPQYHNRNINICGQSIVLGSNNTKKETIPVDSFSGCFPCLSMHLNWLSREKKTQWSVQLVSLMSIPSLASWNLRACSLSIKKLILRKTVSILISSKSNHMWSLQQLSSRTYAYYWFWFRSICPQEPTHLTIF